MSEEKDDRKAKKSHFDKHRTYRCPCQRVCFRQLHEKPGPCRCGRSLDGIKFVIDDCEVSARNGDFAGCAFG